MAWHAADHGAISNGPTGSVLAGKEGKSMSDTQMLIVAGYPDVDVAEREFQALAAKVACQGAHEPGNDPRRQGTRRRAAAHGHRQSHGSPRRWLGRRRRCSRRTVRPADARRGRGRCRRRRRRRPLRRQQADGSHPGAGRCSAQGRHGGHHRRVPGRGTTRGRAGAARSAGEVRRRERREGNRRAQGQTGRGDGQVPPRPHGAADPRQVLQRCQRAHDRRVGR